MREIKFRAWNSVDKMFIEWSTLKASPVLFMNILKSKIKHTELMQYTGLKDKNGIEIYEGDIVYINGYGEYLCEFPFLELYDAVMENDVGEIIGNIHQNPDLAK